MGLFLCFVFKSIKYQIKIRRSKHSNSARSRSGHAAHALRSSRKDENRQTRRRLVDAFPFNFDECNSFSSVVNDSGFQDDSATVLRDDLTGSSFHSLFLRLV